MGARFKTDCYKCIQETNHDILHEEKRSFYNSDTDIWAETKYEMIQCAWCESISFRKVSICSEDFSVNEDDQNVIFDERIEYFPTRWRYKLPMKIYYNAEPVIKDMYREIILSFNEWLYITCSIWIRAILEALCISKWIEKWPNNNGVIVTNLEWKINQLSTEDFLTKTYTKILHSLRFLWNDSAHDIYRPTFDELRLAIDIINHTLDNLYEIPEKNEWLILKRQKRENKKFK